MNITDISCPARLFCSEKNWVEGAAVEQLKLIAGWPGVELAVGMPDLHPGKGVPIGAAFLSRDAVYPFAVGNDIGCGMGLWQTSLPIKKLKKERLAARLATVNGVIFPGDAGAWLAERGYVVTGYETGLGTIGKGNHFAELLETEQIVDAEAWDGYGLDRKRLFLLVHSGSRGHGEALYREHVAEYADRGLPVGSVAADSYLERHRRLLQWARVNRELIAAGLLAIVGTEAVQVLDNCHNSITPVLMADGVPRWLHRKGAAAADAGPVLIAGSRGSHSYLVEPCADSERNAFSIAHGAGRKWNRQSVKGRLKSRFSADDLRQTALHSLVVCRDKDLLYEEAPQAYKNIDQVIADLERFALIRVVAKFKPVLTFKQ